MSKFFLLFISVFFLFACTAPEPGPVGADSPEHLLELTKKYYSKRDVNNMMRLYKTEGISAEVIAQQKKSLKKFFSRNAESFTLINLDDKARRFFNQRLKVNGQTSYYNINLIGQITIVFDNSREDVLLYGQDMDKYFFSLQVIE